MNKNLVAHGPMKHRYMRQKELMTLVPFSHATLWRLVKAGKFVRPVKLSDRITAWNREAVNEWLQEREGQV